MISRKKKKKWVDINCVTVNCLNPPQADWLLGFV